MPFSDHTAARTTIWDKADILEEHSHNSQMVYPSGAAAITVTGAAGAWTLGSFTEIVPVNTITEDFDIHRINVEAVSATDTYEIVLYVEETEIGRTRLQVLGTPANTIIVPQGLQTPILAANSQIQAKIMTASGGSATCDISLEYHVY